MNITLNIGLEVSKNYTPAGVSKMELEYTHVKNFLEQAIGTPIYIGLTQSATEKTVVVEYTGNVESILNKLFWIAHEFKQDCIAYAIKDGDTVLGGALVGNYAHEWNHGIFNADYFIQPMFKLHPRTTDAAYA